MNWDAIAAIAEIAGAIAVVTTLVYFVMQIRQYATGLRSATFHTTMQEFNQINVAQLDPALADLLDRGMDDPGSLCSTETYQFGWIVRVYVNIWESMYQQYLQGAFVWPVDSQASPARRSNHSLRSLRTRHIMLTGYWLRRRWIHRYLISTPWRRTPPHLLKNPFPA